MSSNPFTRSVVALAAGVVCAHTITVMPAAQTEFAFPDGPCGEYVLHDLAVGADHAVAWAINEAGEVAGEVGVKSGSGSLAFRTKPNSPVDLNVKTDLYDGPANVDYSRAKAIDSHGRIAGATAQEALWVLPAQYLGGYAFSASGPRLAADYLHGKSGFAFTMALGVNDAGWSVGYVQKPSTSLGLASPRFPMLSMGYGTTISLEGVLGIAEGEAVDVNNRGEILVQRLSWTLATGGLVLDTVKGRVMPLPPQVAKVSAMNDRGEIVGQLGGWSPSPAFKFSDANGDGFADPAEFDVLGAGLAMAVSNRGVTVGSNGSNAVVFHKGQAIVLDSIVVNRPPHLELVFAAGINDGGQIVGGMLDTGVIVAPPREGFPPHPWRAFRLDPTCQ